MTQTLSRRKFIAAAASGLFIPAAPYVIVPGRAQLPMTGAGAGAPGGGGGCAAVLPTALASGLLWYRADAGVTLSSGNVTAVTEQFGYLGSSNLINVGTVPWSATAFNGFNAFNFNSTGGGGGSLANGLGRLNFLTNQLIVFAAAGFVNGGQNSGALYTYTVGDMFSTTGATWAIMNNTATTQTNLENGIIGSSGNGISPAVASGNFYSFCSELDGVNENVYVNNVIGTSVPSTQNIDNSSSANLVLGGPMLGGSENTSFLNWNGPVAEIIFATSATSAERCGINQYFKNKYGI
jgi:hypothetical protein